MMTTDEAQQLWQNYSGKSYIYKSGKFINNVVTTKGWEIKAGVMFIEMSDGQFIDQRNFNQILGPSNKQVHVKPIDQTSSDFYNSGGETKVNPNDIHATSPTSKRYNIPDLDTEGTTQPISGKRENGIKIPTNPIHTILESAPQKSIANIPIEIKVDIVNDEVIKLLELTFPDKSFKETIEFYKDKINIESIQNSIESSLATYLSTKFSNITPEMLAEFEEGVEGTIIEE